MYRFASILLAAVLLVLAGCAAAPKHQFTAEELARYADKNPETLVNDVRARLTTARDEELPFYARNHFARAEKAAREAAKLLKEKADREDILVFVASAEREIDAGFEVKERVFAVLGGVIEIDRRLKDLGAPAAYPAEYKGLSGRFSGLVAQVEEGHADKAKEGSTAVRADMEALKIRIIKEQVLGQAKKLLDQLEQKGDTQYAPQAVEEARASYRKAEAFIQLNADDEEKVSQAGERAFAAAHRAVNFAAHVKGLNGKTSAELEALAALAEEKRLHGIAAALGLEAPVGLGFTEQAARYAESIKGLRTRLAEAEASLAAERDKRTSVEQALDELRLKGNEDAEQLRQEKFALQQQIDALRQEIAGLESQNSLLKESMTTVAGAGAEMADEGAEGESPLDTAAEADGEKPAMLPTADTDQPEITDVPDDGENGLSASATGAATVEPENELGSSEPASVRDDESSDETEDSIAEPVAKAVASTEEGEPEPESPDTAEPAPGSDSEGAAESSAPAPEKAMPSVETGEAEPASPAPAPDLSPAGVEQGIGDAAPGTVTEAPDAEDEAIAAEQSSGS